MMLRLGAGRQPDRGAAREEIPARDGRSRPGTGRQEVTMKPIARGRASPGRAEAPALWESVPLECLAAALFVILAGALSLAGILP